MHRSRAPRGAVVAALLLSCACDEPRNIPQSRPPSSSSSDAAIPDGASGADATSVDASAVTDAGSTPMDAASTPVDAGNNPMVMGTSDGQCPDLSSSGISMFSSGGAARKVAVIFPSSRPTNMPAIFSWHGLTTLDQMPVENTVSGFQLQQRADAENLVFVVPEARPRSLPGAGTLGMWGIMNDADPDLTLFDDLLTCLTQLLQIDTDRVSSWGHSGGALWTSVLLIERSSVLSSVVELSGGVEFSLPLLGQFIPYRTPQVAIPTLLVTGGMNDVWPDNLAFIRFENTTDTLQAGLLGDGHTVVRCRHELGHFQLPQRAFALTMSWMLEHRRGQTSTFLPDGLSMDTMWCEAVTE